MRFLEVLRFEIGHRFRQPSTWLYAALLLGFPILVQQGNADQTPPLNSPLSIAGVTFLTGFLGMFITAAFVGDAATRDDATQMDAQFYTSPLHRWEYLGGRFLGAMAANGLLLVLVPLGLFISTKVPYNEPVVFAPFRAAAYWQPFVVLILPTTVALGALLFAVAAYTRRTLPMYVAATAAIIGYAIAADRLRSLRFETLSSLLDPFGVIPLQRHAEFWSQAERASSLIGFPAIVVWNRLLWLVIGAGLLALLHARYRFERAGTRARFFSFAREETTEPGRDEAPLAAPLVAAAHTKGRAQGRGAGQFLAIATSALREILISKLFLLIVLGALFVTVVFGLEVGAIVFDTSTYPVTHLVATEVLSIPVLFIMSLLIAIYAGELVWRDRDTGMHAITGAAPISDAVALGANFTALVAMIVALQGVFMVAGMVVQAVQGYYHFEPLLYLRILFGFSLVDYLLFAVLAMTVHVVVNQKVLGHLVMALFFAFTIAAGPLLGIRHHLLIYGDDPGWVYSDMNGFGPFVGPFIWFKLYWGAWALLLAVVATLFWIRGAEPEWSQRLRLARARFRGRTAHVSVAAVALIGLFGGFIFYNTNVLNHYPTPTEGRDRSAAYERKYKRYESTPQPRITAASLNVEIHPARRSVEIRGRYSLENQHDVPVDFVHLRLSRSLEVRSLGFDRATMGVLDDVDQGYRILALAEPLAPGDSLHLDFEIAFGPKGFPNDGINTAVARNGAYFDRRWLPVIGYQAAYELADAPSRKKAGLPPAPGLPALDNPTGRMLRFSITDADLVMIDAVIGTDEDQVAITPGRLVREWRENGRRYFHYRTDTPLSFGSPFLSARYALFEDRWGAVALRIYHHPTHTQNLHRLMNSMKASLDYYTANFGPYQFPELRIVEFPRYATFARAHPHTIAFSEGGSLLTRVEEWDVDRPFFVVAHETAHQWWGNAVAGARVKGAALLSETLAQYGAIMVLEKTYGVEQARKFYAFEMEYYVRGRNGAVEREPPMLEVEEQSHLYYRKGSLVMYTLRDRLGEARVNTALRRYLERFRGAPAPFPTSLDLYAELKAVTPDSLRGLLSDLFERVTLWDVRTDSARIEPLADGTWRVTLDITASKTYDDTTGKPVEWPMDEVIEIGAFSGKPSDEVNALGEPIYLRQHRIRSGPQRITFVVDRAPGRAGIDPYWKLIQRRRTDNVIAVTR